MNKLVRVLNYGHTDYKLTVSCCRYDTITLSYDIIDKSLWILRGRAVTGQLEETVIVTIPPACFFHGRGRDARAFRTAAPADTR